MIRTTKHSLAFTNKGKQDLLDRTFILYKHDLQLYVDALLSKALPLVKLLSKSEVTNTLITSSVWKQILYKEASSIVRNALERTRDRVFKRYKKIYAICISSGRHQWFTSKRFSELNINYCKRTKVVVKNISIPLDQRLVDVESGKHFDWFLRITTPIEYYSDTGVKHFIKIHIPINNHKHSLKYMTWKRSLTVKIGPSFIQFTYEREEAPKKQAGKTLGIDLGYNKLITTNEGTIYGAELKSIYTRLANKKRGSKNYTQLLQHKKDEINRATKSLLNENIHTLYCEDLKELRKSSRMASTQLNKQQYFTYAQVLAKLESLSEEEGFYLTRVNPAYTSQTCSKCGEIHKESRSGECFKCVTCGMFMDADINAAINILHRGAYGPPATENSSGNNHK